MIRHLLATRIARRTADPAPARRPRRSARFFPAGPDRLESRRLLAAMDLAAMSPGLTLRNWTWRPAVTGPIANPPVLESLPAPASGPVFGANVTWSPQLPSLSNPLSPYPQHLENPGPSPLLTMVPFQPAGVAGQAPGFVSVERNTGNVTVQVGGAAPRIIAGQADGITHPEALAVADLDGDQIPDLIVANTGSNELRIFRGNASQTFGPMQPGGPTFRTGDTPVGLAVGDLNRDGIPDVVVANRGSNTVSIFLGQGRGDGWSLELWKTLDAGANPVAVAISDVNQDGAPDLMICNSGSDDLTEYDGSTSGPFDLTLARTITVGSRPVQLYLGRFDRRNGLDVVTVNAGSDDLSLVSGLAGPTPTVRTIDAGGLRPTAAAATDLDRDGYTDLVVLNSDDGSLAFFRGGSAGLSLTGVLIPAPGPGYQVPPQAVALDAATSPTGFDVYTGSAWQTGLTTIHFDLGQLSEFDPGTSVDRSAPPLVARDSPGGAGSAQWLTSEDRSFNLVGVLGLPSARSARDLAASGDRAVALTSKGGARPSQRAGEDDPGASDEGEAVAEAGGDPSDGPTPGWPDEGAEWARLVAGLDPDLGDARVLAARALTADPEASDPAPEPGQGAGGDVVAGVAAGSATEGEALAVATDGQPAPARPDESAPRSRRPGRMGQMAAMLAGVVVGHLVFAQLQSGRGRGRGRRRGERSWTVLRG